MFDDISFFLIQKRHADGSMIYFTGFNGRTPSWTHDSKVAKTWRTETPAKTQVTKIAIETNQIPVLVELKVGTVVYHFQEERVNKSKDKIMARRKKLEKADRERRRAEAERRRDDAQNALDYWTKDQ